MNFGIVNELRVNAPIEIAGGIKTNGPGVPPIEQRGSIDTLRAHAGFVAGGGGFDKTGTEHPRYFGSQVAVTQWDANSRSPVLLSIFRVVLREMLHRGEDCCGQRSGEDDAEQAEHQPEYGLCDQRERGLAEAAIPGARVQAVASRYAICPSLIYRWPRDGADVAAGSPSRVHRFPVRLEAASEAVPGPGSRAAGARQPGIIQIELNNGVRVSVDEGVGTAALRRVISVLRG